MSMGADYVHNEGRGWLAYDLNPGLRVNTTRTGAIVRTDLLGLAAQLGIAPFSNSVLSRFDYSGATGTMVSTCLMERRYRGFWGARVGYTLGYARGNNSGAPVGDEQFPGAGRA